MDALNENLVARRDAQPAQLWRVWLEGARLRTLPAAAAPVLVGAGAAAHMGAFSWEKTLTALFVALCLQVGVNFANDYSDGVRGTDRDRVGPPRLTALGVVSAQQVLRVALGCLGLAAIAGFFLVAWSGTWWFLLVGLAAIVAAWFYTGGKHPYGYAGVGLSEILVFVFFGLVATIGTAWVQAYSAPLWLWVAASGIGLASVSLLFVNNIRDIPTDRHAGKITLAVRLGDRHSRLAAVLLLVLASACGGLSVALISWPTSWGAGAGLLLLAASLATIFPLLRGAEGHRLLPALRGAGLFALLYGVTVGALLAAL